MKKINLAKVLRALAFLVVSGVALHAQVLQNGDFSDVSPHAPVGPGGYEQQVPPTYFTGETGFANTGGVLSDSIYAGLDSPTPYDLYLDPDGRGATLGGSPGLDGVYQDLGALKPLTYYAVTVYESTGSNSSYAHGATTFQLALYNGTDASTTPIAMTKTSLLGPSGLIMGSDGVYGDAQFIKETVSFTTGAVVSGDLTFGVSAYDAVGQNAGQVFVADATLVTPEPSTWALMALGLGGLAFGLCRRASRNS